MLDDIKVNNRIKIIIYEHGRSTCVLLKRDVNFVFNISSTLKGNVCLKNL